MNKLNLHPPRVYQTGTQPAAVTFPAVQADTALGTRRHLIVLVPEETDDGDARRQILERARGTGMNIQLLCLCRDAAQELGLRRRLVTMASLLQQGKTHVDIKVALEHNWVDAVRAIYKPGDVIACFAGQQTGLLQTPVNQLLESNFKAAIYILSGLSPRERETSVLTTIGVWLGFIGIVVGFGILQAAIVGLPAGWLQSFLLILSLLPEFWLIWVWPDQFN